MIPTRYRSKLPKTLSFPLGAEAISECLSHAPHYSEFSISFRGIPWGAAAFWQTLDESSPYEVCLVDHWPISKYASEERWEITVKPVLRTLRRKCGLLLREKGLPLVVEWLQSEDPIAWRHRHHRIALVFDPSEGTVTPERSSREM